MRKERERRNSEQVRGHQDKEEGGIWAVRSKVRSVRRWMFTVKSTVWKAGDESHPRRKQMDLKDSSGCSYWESAPPVPEIVHF